MFTLYGEGTGTSKRVEKKLQNKYGMKTTTHKLYVDEKKSPGNYFAVFDATGLSSGMYVYRIKAGEFIETKKMILLK